MDSINISIQSKLTEGCAGVFSVYVCGEPGVCVRAGYLTLTD